MALAYPIPVMQIYLVMYIGKGNGRESTELC